MRTDAELTAYENSLVREALLKAQSKWLTEADNGETVTLRTIARVIADSFRQEADNYKTKETKDHGSFFDLTEDDESATSSALHNEGRNGESSG